MSDQPARDPQACEIIMGGSVYEGRLPLIPMRYHISAAQTTAHGWTTADQQAIAAGTEGVTRSAPGDGYALRQVYAAVVGECWPQHDRGWPTMADCRHDVLKYGAGVYDALYRRFDGERGITTQIIDEGRRLLAECAKDTTSIFTEVEAEVDFTGAPEADSTTATG